MKVVVLVWLKPGISDPVGKDLTRKSKALGLPISNIATGKHFDLTVKTDSQEEATQIVTEACNKLLANLVIERFEIQPMEGADAKTSGNS